MDIFSKNKFLFWVIIIFLIINTTSIIYLLVSNPGRPDYPDKPHDKRKGPPMKESMLMRDVLGFDSEQSKIFDEIEKRFFEEDKKLHSEFRINKEKIAENLASDSSSKESLDKLTEETVQIFRKLRINNQQRFTEIRQLCNEKQNEKFAIIIHEIINSPPQGFPPPEEMRKGDKDFIRQH